MNPPLKVGDRVRKRGTKKRGEIKRVEERDQIGVLYDDDTEEWTKGECLKRLKPKRKAREFTIAEYRDEGRLYVRILDDEESRKLTPVGVEVFRVREVIARKGK